MAHTPRRPATGRSTPAARRFALHGVAALVALTAAGCRAPEATAPQAVVLVVLDNVRADRLSLCGYERQTSRRLEALCRRDDAACTCRAIAPSSWTLPSHASFFTGEDVPVHGAGMAGVGGDVGVGTVARPLGVAPPTLAERMAERGYRTVLVSANPLLAAPSGLARGFQRVETAESFGEWYGRPLVERLERLLQEELLPEGGPLFLVVNIADAHQPWLEVPAGVEGFPRRGALSFPLDPESGNPERRRFVRGEMAAAEAAALLEHLDDVYDYAVLRADRVLGALARILRRGGWDDGGMRLVVTSDHGEHLGDHGLLGHAGPFLYEEVAAVPLAVVGERGLALPEPVSATAVHSLVLDGDVAAAGGTVRAYAYPSEPWSRWYGPAFGVHPAVGLWWADGKALRQGGELVRFDLVADAGERAPLPVEEAVAARLEEMAEAMEASAAGLEPADGEMAELLRALGYLD